jgi:hypothetical protein
MDIVKRDGQPKNRKSVWKVSDKMRSTGGTGVPWKYQSEWIVDDRGGVCVDFVGRYETLHKDFKTLCDMIGIKASLPHINKSDRKAYYQYYDDETKAIVRDWHKRDIERFGYTFDKPILIL